MARIWRYRVWVVLGTVAATTVGAWWFDRLALKVQVNSYLFSYGFWASSLPLCVLLGALIVLTRRAALASFVSLALIACLCLINAEKIKYLALPLTAFDGYLVKHLDWNTAVLFAHYINVGWLTLGLALLIAGGVLLWRIEKPMQIGTMPLRICCLAVILGFGAYVLFGSTGRTIYSEALLGTTPSSPLLTQFHAGLLGSLLHETNYMGQALDEPIDGHAVKQLKIRLNMPPSDAATFAGIPPDVVVIQSESFFNLDVLENVLDTKQLLPTFHQAMAVGVSGLIAVPTFGGGTLRTEFEVLTGIPLAAYPRMQFPYLQISRDTLPGLPRAFDDAGYRTVAVHGNSGEFWNRRYTFRSLGFSTFVTAHEFKPTAFKDGLFLSDHSMTDEIIAQLQREERPTFVFAVSIEAHGPYKEAPINDEARRMAIAMPAGLSRVGRDEFSRYAYHIAAADREFGRLWSYLEHRGRPYVLVFYGDHLPGFEKVYRELRFRNGQSAELQRVPWVAVSNVSGHGSTKNMYAWMLPQTVLELAHVKAPSYFAFAAAAGRQAMGEGEGADNSQLLDGLYSAARLQLDGAFDDVDPKVRHAL